MIEEIVNQVDSSANPYLKPGRFEDVLSLIQVLALAEWSHRSDASLDKSMKVPPRSAGDWVTVAVAHPELFRVLPAGKKNRVSLWARHLSPADENSADTNEVYSTIDTDGEGRPYRHTGPGYEGSRPPLSPEMLQQVIQIAVVLCDLQTKRLSFRISTIAIYLGSIAAVIAAVGAAILTAILSK